jgi:hypothetical protein
MFVQKLPGREVAYTGQQQREMAVTHLQLAEARTKIDVAELCSIAAPMRSRRRPRAAR